MDNITDREWMLWVGVYVRALPDDFAAISGSGVRRDVMNRAADVAAIHVEHLRDKAQRRLNEETAPKRPPVKCLTCGDTGTTNGTANLGYYTAVACPCCAGDTNA